MATMNCLRCDSDKVMQDMLIRNEMGLGINIAVINTEAPIFQKTKMEALKASVCGECGNVELTVNNPKQLWEHYSLKKNT
ncbi:hypothetical protein C6497_01800 [Candidatus Poribacteria bacterium]|nr:MAG: hypothetical protein C6497_01800 [Candidatus Poribacteria bacterium]